MSDQRVRRAPGFLLIFLLSFLCFSTTAITNGQTPRSPSDVVREFYKAMREHRFKDAWSMTIYRSAIDDLSAEEMEDWRPACEAKASQVPPQIEITGEQIQGNIATVFVKVPVSESTPQITSEPVNLLNSGGNWIIGTEADLAEVKKKGRRFFLDALIEENETDVQKLLTRISVVQLVYSQQKGQLGDLQGLIAADLIAKESADPKAMGYTVKITI